MANEFRSSENAKSGTLTPGNSLTNAATSMVSSALAQVQAVDSTKHVRIVLDPLGTGNGPEVAFITAHTAASTGATIVRGREGTTGVAHTSTTAWVHGPGISDHIWRGTSAERNALTGGVPFVGQFSHNYTSTTFEVYQSATTGWTPPWNMGWGELAKGGSPTSTATIAAGAGGVETVYMTTSAVSTPANRLIEVTFEITAQSGTASVHGVWNIRRGTTTGGTQLKLGGFQTSVTINSGLIVAARVVDAPSVTTSLQYVLTMSADSGWDVHHPSEYIVRDVGPAGPPT